tara:strand:- start:74 stop:448 length:375 start_codon:yes stop_codon:yes gene_type:complete
MKRKQFLALVQSYIAQNDMDLQNAVLLLGGSSALMRLQRFRRSLMSLDPKTIHLTRDLTWLNDLLSLEHVGDVDREESGYFSTIHPDDPEVWTICALTEAVSALLAELDVLDDAIDDQNKEVAA